MCGICAIIGYDNSFTKGYTGISKLLNRGYDSIGVTTIKNDNTFITHKHISDDEKMADLKILEHESEHDGTISIFHSRWRTTGGKTEINSHPHIDMFEKFSLVHNGIIENYIELKDFLEKKNYLFKSETDTEVIVNLISYFYFNFSNDPILAIKQTLEKLEGTYALVIACIDYPDTLYCVRHGSPMLIGYPQSQLFYMIASEHYAFDKTISSYITINSNDIISLKKSNNIVTMTSFENNIYHPKKINLLHELHSPQPYKHWTLKEINDQTVSCLNAINGKGRIDDMGVVKLGGFENHINELIECDNLIMLACGTSYNSALLSTHIFKEFNIFNSIHVIDGAEFTLNDIPKNGKTCVIFISQSGETKDLHMCLETCKNARYNNIVNLVLVGIINVVDSMIAREVDCGIYLNCGREFAVASTKAFSSQVIVLTLVAIWFDQHKHGYNILHKKYADEIIRLPIDIKTTIELNEDKCKYIAKYLKTKPSAFLLGRGIFEAIAKEGSLKMKEIGYIHAEGYSSLALKHGPYALLEEGYPIFLLSPNNKDFIKNQCILDELKGRDAYVIGISDVELCDKYNVKLKLPTGSFTPITCAIILQLVSYYLGIEKNINVDFPKNLSKTVSVI
jgi:glucosamine--fructose-6-phosphate aminotransferase (isomerizing)